MAHQTPQSAGFFAFRRDDFAAQRAYRDTQVSQTILRRLVSGSSLRWFASLRRIESRASRRPRLISIAEKRIHDRRQRTSHDSSKTAHLPPAIAIRLRRLARGDCGAWLGAGQAAGDSQSERARVADCAANRRDD